MELVYPAHHNTNCSSPSKHKQHTGRPSMQTFFSESRMVLKGFGDPVHFQSVGFLPYRFVSNPTEQEMQSILFHGKIKTGFSKRCHINPLDSGLVVCLSSHSSDPQCIKEGHIEQSFSHQSKQYRNQKYLSDTSNISTSPTRLNYLKQWENISSRVSLHLTAWKLAG
ncbi:hypothetical protein KIL84_017937 [Mauremys mutica]|uniref:Uncharacterized protein n=1 Tax=Mauremys mutica TaxID=74926 RepID=A0A9D4B8I1_9SAUR|nr:hypothetical protein KIL84_017937 [Mauremys mutica]